jgi:hypothetical protein
VGKQRGDDDFSLPVLRGGSKGRHFVAARRCSLKVVAVLVTDGGRRPRVGASKMG